MEKIRLSFFDTFAYLLPGIFIIIAILIALNTDIQSIQDLHLVVDS